MDPQEMLALLGYQDAPPVQPDPVPHDGDYSAVIDFQPQTFDFGGGAPQTVEYDQAGNPAPVAPVMPPTPEEMEPGYIEMDNPDLAPGASHSSSVSTQGYSPQKAAQIERGPYGSNSFDKVRGNAEARIRAGYADEMAGMQAADQAETAAAGQLANAETEQVQEKARQSARMSQHMRETEQGLRTIYESGQLAANQAKNEYLMRLASIPELNPNALWDEAGDSGRFQIAVAAVVHNMLGVKGINTTAMDTINQAIKNKIDAQVQNIANKKFVAAGFKDLWEATVAESASRMEAEAKMQGYLLKAFEHGIDAQMGRVDSNVARAKHAMAKAEIQKAQVKNRIAVEKYIQDGTQQAVETEAGLYKARLAASVQRDQMAHAERMANAKKKDDEGIPRFIHDPETGRGKWVFKPWVKNEQASKVLEQVAKFEPANITMNKIRELERKMKPVFDPISGTRFAPEEARQYDAYVQQLAHQLVAARGERPTDRDIIQQLKALPTNTTFTRGGVERILANTQAGLNSEVQAVIGQFADDVPEQAQPPGVRGRIAEGSFTDAVGTAAGLEGSPLETKVKAVVAPEAAHVGYPHNAIPKEKEKEWKEFTVPYWKDFLKKNPKFLDKYDATSDITAFAGGMTPDQPPLGFDGLRELAEVASNPALDKTAKAESKLAKDYLRELSAPNRNQPDLSKKENEALAEYAAYFLEISEKASNTEIGYPDGPVTRPR